MDTITEQLIENEEIEMPESPFQITMSLDKDFVRAFKRLSKKYGDQILHINGFAPDQLNFTGFIDNFVDTKTVADATIDGNANSGTKDIVTMQSDMKKPHTKLLSFNKIFYEMRKKYGVDHANKWLEDEWSGALYMHDAYNSSLVPYCIKKEETIIVKFNGVIYNTSLKYVYNKLLKNFPEYIDGEIKFKKPLNLYVRDYNFATQKDCWTKITHISHKPNKKEMHYIRTMNGLSLITTKDHKFFDELGNEYEAQNLNNEYLKQSWELDEIYSSTIDNIKGVNLTKDLGYILGMLISEGSYNGNYIIFSQSYNSDKDILNKLLNCLNKVGVRYNNYKNAENSTRIVIKQGDFKWANFFKSFIDGYYAQEKALVGEYVNYNRDFILGIIAGLIDGDGHVREGKKLALKMSTRTLTQQIKQFLNSQGLFPSETKPWRQELKFKGYEGKLTKPVYSLEINMAQDKDFFLSLNSIKIEKEFKDFIYKPEMAKGIYTPAKDGNNVRRNELTFNEEETFDLTTESHHFYCNNILVHNCYAYDLDQVATKGLFFVSRFKTDPPQHLETFNNHVLEFVSWTSNRQSGAVGLPSYLIYSFYFWKKDVEAGYCKDPERYRDQQFQKFIYDLNQPFLRISECAFTNVSIFDREYIMGIFGGRQYPDGSFVIDYIEELIEYQKAFMRMVSKIRSRTMMTFPVLTYSLLFQNGKFVDEEFARWCNKHNMKWCDSNFFVGSDVTTLSNCCRLLSDTTKVKASGFINSIGGTSLRIGSVKVSTINLRRVALEANGDKNKFFKILKARTMLDIEVLDVVRGIIKRNIEKGLLPQYDYDLMNLDTQYNTIGVTALFECVNEFGGISEDEFGNKYYTDEGLKFATEVLDCIKEVKNNYEADYSINIEAVPAESANVKLCYKDNIVYPEQDKGYFIYSNQWIPLMEKCTLQEKIRLGSILDNACEGGVIAHINLAGEFADEEQAWELLNYIASQGVIYFAYNKEISVCEDEHAFFGDTCPTCGKPKVDSYCRVVGFLTPKSSYSKERKREFDKRKWFSLNNDWM